MLSSKLLKLWSPLNSVTHCLRNASQFEQQTANIENGKAAVVRGNSVSAVLL